MDIPTLIAGNCWIYYQALSLGYNQTSERRKIEDDD